MTVGLGVSSLPGADLVGFVEDEDGTCFAFSEVKTSTELKYPPSAMQGGSGLRSQIRNLLDSTARRDDLVKYICHRAKAVPWKRQLEQAVTRYIQDDSDVRICGFLVRDVKPCPDDLRGTVTRLGSSPLDRTCTIIEFIALYLPRDSIRGIGDAMLRKRGVG